jgi:integrase
MSEVHPTAPATPAKPAKPTRPANFPLFPHATKRWAKKIRGKTHYFGPWEDPDGALARYLEQKDALHAGRAPRPDPGAVTVKDLANALLNAKKAAVDAGELSPRTFADYKEACDLVVGHLGKARLAGDVGPDDLAPLRNKLSQRWGPARLAKTVQCIKTLFKHGYDAGLLDRPTRFGPGFRRPSAKTMRLARAKAGPRLFEAEEVRRLLDAVGVQLRAMLLLGINCGLGNADVGRLPLAALDLERGWLDYPRPKTGIGRRCPLWPETVVTLREALVGRPAPKDNADAGLVFITRYGESYAKDTTDNPITKVMVKLLRRCGVNGHRSFYTLRHTFRTVADEARDQPAADHIMGHLVPHMSAVYRERISDARLRAVVDHVRTWLFGPPAGQASTDPVA